VLKEASAAYFVSIARCLISIRNSAALATNNAPALTKFQMKNPNLDANFGCEGQGIATRFCERSGEKFGFLDHCDFIPAIFRDLPKEQIAAIFLTLYNFDVGDALKIPFSCAKNCMSLREIFENFIRESLSAKPLSFKKTAEFCIASNLILQAHFQNKTRPALARVCAMKAARLAALLQNGVVLDGADAFGNFVLDKISRKNQDAQICLKDEMILVRKCGRRLGIFPYFKRIDPKNDRSFDEDIQRASLSKYTDLADAIYLVYPQNADFKHHVEVKSGDFKVNFIMKLVPYAINNKIF
jgi:hypothetical protein